jgi:hypothetical protein
MSASADTDTEFADAVAALTVQLDRFAGMRAQLQGELGEIFQAEHWIQLGRMLERDEAEKRRGHPPVKQRPPRRSDLSDLRAVKGAPVTDSPRELFPDPSRSSDLPVPSRPLWPRYRVDK